MTNPPRNETYFRLYCEFCSYNRVTTGKDIGDLHELPPSIVPSPSTMIIKYKSKEAMDKEAKNKKKEEKARERKRFRCPQCGRVLFPKKITTPTLPPKEEESVDGERDDDKLLDDLEKRNAKS